MSVASVLGAGLLGPRGNTYPVAVGMDIGVHFLITQVLTPACSVLPSRVRLRYAPYRRLLFLLSWALPAAAAAFTGLCF